MKPSPKGQRVKSFKCFVPQPDLSTVDTQVVVYLDARKGLFSIYDGAHMLDACKDAAQKNYDTRTVSFFDDRISSKVLNELVEGFQGLCALYTRLLREQRKDRVIRFHFKRNLPGTFDRFPKDDISFCGSPAVHFSYEVLWRVKDKLYRQPTPTSALQFAGDVVDRHDEGAAHVVEWTAARENFFEDMERALVALILRVEDFQTNLASNIDLVIAGHASPLLAPPRNADGAMTAQPENQNTQSLVNQT
jgi:hypothetical protein